MRVSKLVSFCILAVAFSGAAIAEVYESKDAQGNTVYSDMPSQGAEVIKVPTTNGADPVAITPRSPPSAETATKPNKSTDNPTGSQEGKGNEDYRYIGGDYDGDEINDQIGRERRREDGEGRPITDRPKVEHHDNTARREGGGAGRR